ncbi:Hyaluronan And Proteoglycan Link Protein 2 [Manis pentadactyla]|nr:Hyaluronan And Proteoglycan Link Protein 2 [Manis pentadactyla]
MLQLMASVQVTSVLAERPVCCGWQVKTGVTSVQANPAEVTSSGLRWCIDIQVMVEFQDTESALELVVEAIKGDIEWSFRFAVTVDVAADENSFRDNSIRKELVSGSRIERIECRIMVMVEAMVTSMPSCDINADVRCSGLIDPVVRDKVFCKEKKSIRSTYGYGQNGGSNSDVRIGASGCCGMTDVAADGVSSGDISAGWLNVQALKLMLSVQVTSMLMLSVQVN